jgi:hypothetical protein
MALRASYSSEWPKNGGLFLNSSGGWRQGGGASASEYPRHISASAGGPFGTGDTAEYEQFLQKSPGFPESNCGIICTVSELESPMTSVQIEQKSYEMPPRDGFTVTHFLTVADIDRSARFYETVFGGAF